MRPECVCTPCAVASSRPSHPIPSLAVRELYAVRRYKRNPPPLHFIRAEVPLSAPVSNRLLPCSSPAAATVDSATHRLFTSLCRSWSFVKLRSCSSTRGTSTFSTGEPQRRHCASDLPPCRRPISFFIPESIALSCGCAVVHGRCPCSPSRQPSSYWSSPPMSRRALCVSSPRALYGR
jgi:hypothetical protein